VEGGGLTLRRMKVTRGCGRSKVHNNSIFELGHRQPLLWVLKIGTKFNFEKRGEIVSGESNCGEKKGKGETA